MKPIRHRNSKKESLQPAFLDDWNGLMHRFFDDSPFSYSNSFFSDQGRLVPAINISEKKDCYAIEVEIPGVDPEEVDIEMEGNVMIVKGEKSIHNKHEDKDAHMHVEEHSYGSFYRTMTLPANIDVDNIEAESKNGMLYIDVPKKEVDKSHKIKINHKK